MIEFNEKRERELFELVAYKEYVANQIAARLAYPDVEHAAIMKEAQVFSEDENRKGEYALKGMDAAWWAWKERSKLIYSAAYRRQAGICQCECHTPILSAEHSLPCCGGSPEVPLAQPNVVPIRRVPLEPL